MHACKVFKHLKSTIYIGTASDARLLLVHQKVPIEQQPPETLGTVGLCLAKRGYRSAQKYFDHLLHEYANSPERGYAYYGQALLLARTQKEAPRLALSQLKRFFRETPRHRCLRRHACWKLSCTSR